MCSNEVRAKEVENFGLNEPDSDDDIPQLSAETLKALKEFYAESESASNQIDEDWVDLTAFL